MSKYIHLNPVKAKLCQNPVDYPYSSYQEYITGKNSIIEENIIDWRAMKRILGDSINQKSIKNYQSFVEEQEDVLEYQPTVDAFGDDKFVTKFKKKG